jgi:hypothetical protein
MQYRSPVGCGPSMNRCPRCASHFAQSTSVRCSTSVLSGRVYTALSSAGAQKLGQPVPESNFSADRKSSAPQQIHRYSPASCSFQYRPVYANSVARCRVTLNCSGDSRRRHSASDKTTLPSPEGGTIAGGSSLRLKTASNPRNAMGMNSSARREAPESIVRNVISLFRFMMPLRVAQRRTGQ